MGTTRTDFVIVAPLGQERDALLERLPGHRKLPPSREHVWVHYRAEVPVRFPDGARGAYSVVVLPLSKIGHTEAATATVDVIRQWRPRYVLLVGIGGGVAAAGVGLGDILIADQVADYELQQVTSDRAAVRWQTHRADQRLLIGAQNFTGRDWAAAAPWPGRGPDAPRVHFGTICTGNKVIADAARTDGLREMWPSLVGVEMEASGVANAAAQAAGTTGFFMIRCVSDLADAEKDSDRVQRWRSAACGTAAAYTIEFLKSGPVPRARGDAEDRGPQGEAALPRDGGRPLSPATEVFVGRAAQIRELLTLWRGNSSFLIQIAADGGTGKTTLVRRWLDALGQDGHRPPDLHWSFYSQGSHHEAVDSTAFFDFAARALGIDPAAIEPAQRRRVGALVARRFAARGGVMVLDGVEPLQHPPSVEGGSVSDPQLHQMLQEFREILRSGGHDGRFLVVITTRWPIPHLDGPGTARLELPALSPSEGADLLRQVRVSGRPGASLEFRPEPERTEQELAATSREFAGHPLALTLLAAYLLAAEDGDLARRSTIPAVTEFPQDIPGYSHARRVMAAYDRLFERTDAAGWHEACRQLLRMIGLFDRPAEPELVDALCRPPIAGLTDRLTSASRYNYAVSRLRDLRLLSPPDPAAPELLDTHPLIREHFARTLRREDPQAWARAHAGLALTLDRSVAATRPTTVREMLTLYRAIAHGCRAGEYGWSWTVFADRVQQDDRFTSTGKLGLTIAEVSALSGFFQTPWHEVADGVPPAIVGSALGRAAFCLRAVGRLRDASSAFEAALAHHERRGDLRAAAADANNYSVGLLQAGDLRRAVELAERSLRYTERSGATRDVVKRRVNLAWLLHYEGRTVEARQGFYEALRLLRELQPEQPRLRSTQGQRYGEFLLEAEPTTDDLREAAAIGQGMIDHPTAVYETLDPAMGYMIRGRAETLLFSSGQSPDGATALSSLKQAEDLSRQTGHRDALVRCLLPLAAASRLAGEFRDAARFLNEAGELIEQHGMHLYLVDCALERAWLEIARGDAATATEFLGLARALRARYAPSYGRHDRAFAGLAARCGRPK
jgi:nucleoside phosphorylase/tetratricopeptide (TPR) repeat protein